MARLPTVGADTGSWGTVLNDFLATGHDAQGNNIGKIVEATKSSSYTIGASDAGVRIVATSGITILAPAPALLGNGFECEVINDSNSNVTIDGNGGTNVTLAAGEVACIIVASSKTRVVKGASTVIS